MNARARALLVTCLLLLAAAPLGAQELRPPASAQDAFTPDFTRRELDLLAGELGLDAAQVEAMGALWTEYEAAFLAGRDRVRARIAGVRPGPGAADEAARERGEAFREQLRALRDEMRDALATTDDPTEQREIAESFRDRVEALRAEMADFGATTGDDAALRAAMAEIERATLEWVREKSGIRDRFLLGVQDLLTPEQAARWLDVERLLRRRRDLPRGVLAGETTDLAVLLEIVDPAPEALVAAEPVLAAWRIEIDAALRARSEAEERWSLPLADALRAEDAAEAASLAARIHDQHRRVRDVNGASMLLLLEALPDEAAAELANEYRRRTFPRVYGPTRAGRLLDAARRLEELDESTREALEALAADYAIERDAMREQQRETIWREEPGQAMKRAIGRPVERAVDPIAAGYARLLAIDDAWIERLVATIGEEAAARLPRGATRGRRDARELEESADRAREGLTKRFDRNGDGVLDAEERDAARRILLEEQGGDGGG